MPQSLIEYLNQDIECEGVLECIHGLKEIDKECFQILIQSNNSLTIDELSEKVNRERSTAYRSLQRLLKNGYVEKEQVNFDQGGYRHVYSARDPEEIAIEMQHKLNEWYADMGQLIHEFKVKYSDIAAGQVQQN